MSLSVRVLTQMGHRNEDKVTRKWSQNGPRDSVRPVSTGIIGALLDGCGNTVWC